MDKIKAALLGAKPILFNGDMVRAVLDGRKSATRRVIKPQPVGTLSYGFYSDYPNAWVDNAFVKHTAPYRPGGIMYVREMWAHPSVAEIAAGADPNIYLYKADEIQPAAWDKWRPNTHMPKEAARLFLRVTGVWARRLQDMTQEDAEREGCFEKQCPKSKFTSSSLLMFTSVWNDCYAAPRPVKENGVITHYESYPWEAIRETRTYKGLPWEVYGNPWVWAIEFERISKEEAYNG